MLPWNLGLTGNDRGHAVLLVVVKPAALQSRQSAGPLRRCITAYTAVLPPRLSLSLSLKTRAAGGGGSGEPHQSSTNNID